MEVPNVCVCGVAVNKQASIEGTTEYHPIMRQIVTNSLQRMAGYIAPTMSIPEIQITPVHENYLEQVDAMMQALANDDSLVNCNPRAPYLLLAWLLVGSDNPYRNCQYVNDTRIHKQVAIIHIRIASGDAPLESEINPAADAGDWAVATAGNVRDAARTDGGAWFASEAASSAAWEAMAAAGAASADVARAVARNTARNAAKNAIKSKLHTASRR